MPWNDHWRIEAEGRHAYLSASKHHWVNYDEAKLRAHFANALKAQEGTELHAIAKDLIKKRIKVMGKHTFAAYVNDAIGFGMDPEVPLVYSEEFFGTPDAIKWDGGKKYLRIHDLKTGVHPGHMRQLKVYAALFFLEYGKLYKVKPHDVTIELRIYQNDEIAQEFAEPAEIVDIMEHGRFAAKIVKEMREGLIA